MAFPVSAICNLASGLVVAALAVWAGIVLKASYAALGWPFTGEALRALERIAPSRRPWAREPGFHPSAAPHGLPELHVHFLPRGVRAGYRAWERLPSLGVAPAFAAAASQATGLFLDRLPLTPEVVQQCLQSE